MIYLQLTSMLLLFIGTTGDAKRLDLEAVGQVNNVSIFEYDIDLGTDEKPWRKPGIVSALFFVK